MFTSPMTVTSCQCCDTGGPTRNFDILPLTKVLFVHFQTYLLPIPSILPFVIASNYL